MTYNETELIFVPEKESRNEKAKQIGGTTNEKTQSINPLEVLGINVRIGNQPLVYRLTDLQSKANNDSARFLPPDRDHYLIIHAISAIRTQGRAKVDELQYTATSIDPVDLQTVDLIPKTRFNEVLSFNANMAATLDLSGQTFLDVPAVLADHLMPEIIDLAPSIQLQLSTSARFIGKLIYSIQIPVVQASGIGSDTCCWVLKPDEKKTPLFGDQLLLQSLSVPIGTNQISYSISALVKADKGLFWKQQQKETPQLTVNVALQPATTKQNT